MRFFWFSDLDVVHDRLTIFEVKSSMDTLNRVSAADDGVDAEDHGAESVDAWFGKVNLAILQTMSTLSLLNISDIIREGEVILDLENRNGKVIYSKWKKNDEILGSTL